MPALSFYSRASLRGQEGLLQWEIYGKLQCTVDPRYQEVASSELSLLLLEDCGPALEQTRPECPHPSRSSAPARVSSKVPSRKVLNQDCSNQDRLPELHGTTPVVPPHAPSVCLLFACPSHAYWYVLLQQNGQLGELVGIPAVEA